MITPVSLEIFRSIFAGIAEEMGSTLERTASSPNIKERRDFSCAIFDSSGQLIAQAAHLPVHLGSMPLLVRKVVSETHFKPGDCIIANDPYSGGTHLPDVTLISPVFSVPGRQAPAAFIANRAHHSDIGGMSPGSMPHSTEVFQEGLIIPPVKLRKGGEWVEDVLKIVLANVRTPFERKGDLEAQVAAQGIGGERILEVMGRYGENEIYEHWNGLLDYSERLTRARLGSLPRGIVEFEDFLEGYEEELIPLKVRISLAKDEVVCDFAGSSPPVENCLNAPLSVTQAAVYYVFRCLLGDDIPPNAGCFRPIQIKVPGNCILNARFPRAIAGGNVEASQRVVDLVMGALARALPDRLPAASSGTMNNLSIGGYDSRRSRYYAYYETVGGGSGAARNHRGASGIHTHMTNTQNTPVEVLEMEYPLRVVEYSIRNGSGGKGMSRGGDGLRRDIQFLEDARLTLISERRRLQPHGLEGGSPGRSGENFLFRKGRRRNLPGKFSIEVREGDVLSIRTPGGGGWGTPGKLPGSPAKPLDNAGKPLEI